jgi:hypothetical protein
MLSGRSFIDSRTWKKLYVLQGEAIFGEQRTAQIVSHVRPRQVFPNTVAWSVLSPTLYVCLAALGGIGAILFIEFGYVDSVAGLCQ